MWAEWDGAAGPIGSSQSNGFHRVGCGRGPAPHHGAGMITSVSMANVTTQPTSPEISIDRVRMTFARPDDARISAAQVRSLPSNSTQSTLPPGGRWDRRIRRRSASLRVHRLAPRHRDASSNQSYGTTRGRTAFTGPLALGLCQSPFPWRAWRVRYARSGDGSRVSVHAS